MAARDPNKVNDEHGAEIRPGDLIKIRLTRKNTAFFIVGIEDKTLKLTAYQWTLEPRVPAGFILSRVSRLEEMPGFLEGVLTECEIITGQGYEKRKKHAERYGRKANAT